MKLILAMFAVLPLSVFAWGHKGHTIVDQIAYKTLSQPAKDSIQHYLGKTKFAEAGTWMDDIRSDHNYDYMKPWHYINIPKGSTYDPRTTNNIVSSLDSSISRLHRRNLYTKEQIATDIKIVMHLMGDLHQPLHVGYATDKGGNLIEVGYLGSTTNLHKVWDSEMIDHLNINTESCPAEPMPQSIDLLKWLTDSRALLDGVYSFANATIDFSYESRNKSVIEKQLASAGARLAFVLNDIFE